MWEKDPVQVFTHTSTSFCSSAGNNRLITENLWWEQPQHKETNNVWYISDKVILQCNKSHSTSLNKFTLLYIKHLQTSLLRWLTACRTSLNNDALWKQADYVGAKVALLHTHTCTHTHTLIHRATSAQGTVRKRRREHKKMRDFCFLPSTTSSNFLQVASTVSSHEFAYEETEELPREAVLLPSQCYFPSLY